jgi:hypothetical protein
MRELFSGHVGFRAAIEPVRAPLIKARYAARIIRPDHGLFK